MTISREDILRKIKAMLATAERGGTEAEMATAAELAALWMARYNIEHIDLQDHGHVIDELRVNGKYKETWRNSCYSMAARMYMCRHHWITLGTKDVAVVHVIVGEEHNRIVTAEVARYFEEAINRLANGAARENKDLAHLHTERHRFIRSFRLAAARRLDARVNEYIRRARAGSAQDAETGTTLPALESLYQQQDRLYEAWSAAIGLKLRQVSSRDQLLSDAGRIRGSRAAETISLSTQVRSRSGAPALQDQRR